MGNFFTKLFLQVSSNSQNNNMMVPVSDSDSDSDTNSDIQHEHTENCECGTPYYSNNEEEEAVDSDDDTVDSDDDNVDSDDDDEAVQEKEEEEEKEEEKEVIFFNKKNTNKKALLIGINYDKDTNKNDDLNGCVNDLNNIKDFLMRKCNFKDDQIVTLYNDKATKNNIEMDLLRLVDYTHHNPNSEVWLSYSGHGSTMPSYYESDNKSEVICPSDYMINGIITDLWLQNNFVKMLERTANTFVLMDCCNSGSNLNLPYRGMNQDVCSNDNSYSFNDINKLCNIVKISGCEDDQTSADYFDRKDNEFQGALTNSFLLISNNVLDKSVNTLYNNTLLNLKSRGFTQRPVLSFSHPILMYNSKLYN